MQKVLVVSSGESSTKFITDLLEPRSYAPVTAAGSGAQARRRLAENDYDLILINAPLSDEMGHELAMTAAHDSAAGVLLLVKAERADEVAARVEHEGVLVLSKPLARPLFFQSLRLAAAVRARLLALRKENQKLRCTMEEVRLVDRAKCALIQCLLMTEPQAHRYIEKQAMDLRVSRREVAQSILKTYEI